MNAICTFALFLVAACTAFADVESGPKPGEKVTELKIFAATGMNEGKDVDIAKLRKDEPTIYLFVNAEKFTRPMAKFLRAIDAKVSDDSDKAIAVAIWVGGDTDKMKEYLPKAQMSLKLVKTDLTVYTENKTGPNGWGLNNDAHLTAVIVNGGKVVKSFAFVSVDDSDAKGVLEALKVAVKK